VIPVQDLYTFKPKICSLSILTFPLLVSLNYYHSLSVDKKQQTFFIAISLS
jgi:hypothetical protein